MRFTPCGDRVLVQLDAPEETWGKGSALVRPDSGKEKPVWGTAIAVGAGRVSRRGALIPTGVRRGDRVCIPWATGHDLKIGGQLHVAVKADDILAVEDRA